MFESIIEGVWWIPGRDKFLPDSHMYVIGLPSSGNFTLVDCGMMNMAEYKLEQIKDIGIDRAAIKRIILTHTHIDHIGCLPELLEAMPHLEVWSHEKEAGLLEKGDESIIMGSPAFEQMVRDQFTLPPGYFKTTVHRRLTGGETLSLGGLAFEVFHIPGHSAGSIGLFLRDKKLFLSGDTIYADGAIGRYDLVSADPLQLRDSLELIESLGVEALLPCHNRVMKQGAERMISNTVAHWRRYLEE